MSQFLAIDADARGLFVAVGTTRNGVASIDAATARVGELPPLTSATAHELGGKLRELLDTAGIRPAPVLLCIGRDRVVLKEVRHPPTPPSEEPAVVKFQAVKDISESPDDVVMDYTPLPPAPDGERRATVAFVRKEVVAAARQFCEAAGLKLTGITPRSFLAPALLRHAIPEADATPTGILSLWTGGGEFTVVRGRNVLFSRAIPESATENEARLVGELRRNLTVFTGQFPNDPLRAIHLTESATPGAGWSGRLDGALSVPVIPFDPLEGLDVPGVPDSARGRFFAPVGALAARATDAGLPINFASTRQPRSEANPARRKILLAASVAAALLLSALGLGIMERSRAAAAFSAAMLHQTQVDKELQNLELNAKRLAAADEFTKREVVWLDEIYDLTDRFPDTKRMRVSEFEGIAIAPPKSTTPRGAQPRTTGGTAGTSNGSAFSIAPVKPIPVGQIRLVLGTEDARLVDHLADETNRDTYYTGTQKTTAGLVSSGSRLQQFTVTTQVLYRVPSEFDRKLNVSPPSAPITPPPTPVPTPTTPVAQTPTPKPTTPAATTPLDGLDLLGGINP